MKITLNISKLLAENKISKEEYDRLLAIAKSDSSSHALLILCTLAIIAMVLGGLSLVPDVFLKYLFIFIEQLYSILGNFGMHLLVVVVLWIIGVYANSGFLVGISAFVILSLLGGSTFYSSGRYLVAIREPAFTVIIFSLLSIISLFISKKFDFKKERLAIIFSRTCLIIVNMGFWIGSIWGSKLGDKSYIASIPFAITWAIAVLIVGIWGAREGRAFVVNTCAVFGSINFYTQWFAHLGASPITLFFAGIIALTIVYLIRQYNKIAAEKMPE